MSVRDRMHIKPGTRVSVVRKQDQVSGRLTQGIVKDILTHAATHPRGIKVRLTNGEVGRVKEILESLNQEPEVAMESKKTKWDNAKIDRVVSETRRKMEQLEKTYREKALKILPWVCARCGREFGNKNIHQLTVHHRDNDHTNNPPDGSNWELLCIYCHDNEHSRDLDADGSAALTANELPAASTTHKPFAGLQDLLNQKKQKKQK